MKILQVGQYPEYAVLEVPDPQPGPGEVLLKVEAVTTCPQWDLHLRHNEPMFLGHQFHYPYTLGQPGHEATGSIAAIGSDVTGVSVGDRVSAWRDPGHNRPGGYAQYMVLSQENVIHVPAHLPLESTASVELAMCVGATFLMLKEMNAVTGKRFGITGLGPAGLIAAQMARAEGAASIIGFDLSPVRREYAASFCLDEAYDPRTDLSEDYPARPKTPRLDTVVDCVGAKASVEFAMDHARETVALFGVQREDYLFAPRHYGHLRLCGYPGHSRAAADYAVGLIEQNLLNLAPLVTHHLPLERYGEGIDLLESQEAIKICFHPWETE
jgi:threonine dehydrogenase-like Zn-dependent dehydrogenase